MSDVKGTSTQPPSNEPRAAEEKALAAGPPKQAWGAPLLRLDTKWMTLEQYMCVWVIVAEIAVLCLWVSLTGLSSHYEPGGGNIAGLVYRAIVSAVVLGSVTHFALRPTGKETGEALHKRNIIHQSAVTAAVVIGLFVARFWANGGGEYSSNLRAWIQNASVLMLIGGLRGLVTRLTLWLALLGASIATSRGKHINIDVAARLIPKRLVAPVAILGWAAAAAVCFMATWGFIDGISVTKFDAEAFTACTSGQGEGAGHLCDTPISSRLSKAEEGMSSDAFLFGRQLSLDLRSLPKVIAGSPYDTWMSAAEWNAWMTGARWTDHFSKDGVDALMVPDALLGTPKMPAVSAPGASSAAGLLIRDLDFILPFGLLVIGIKFVIRILLVLSGHVRIDLDSAHGDDEDKHLEHHDAADDLGTVKGGVS